MSDELQLAHAACEQAKEQLDRSQNKFIDALTEQICKNIDLFSSGVLDEQAVMIRDVDDRDLLKLLDDIKIYRGDVKRRTRSELGNSERFASIIETYPTSAGVEFEEKVVKDLFEEICEVMKNATDSVASIFAAYDIPAATRLLQVLPCGAEPVKEFRDAMREYNRCRFEFNAVNLRYAQAELHERLQKLKR